MSTPPDVKEIEIEIRSTLAEFLNKEKRSKQGSKIHARLDERLQNRGWQVLREYLISGEAWLDNLGNPAPAKSRAIDLAVCSDDKPFTFIEVESDLAHAGKVGPGSHYSVKSLSRDARGHHFMSYQSLERMAVAVKPGRSIAEISSDSPQSHNPHAIPLFLVVHNCRKSEIIALEPRCKTLGVKIICEQIRS
ncbi:hypothetical protein [Aphanothece minutissima]|uniref:hypothetical protein n=1 Tax=Aphanothece minutissima TaxID=543815 RepID=UPI0011B1E7D6|nr:hypothetical protein [Aphanothece minutissima]